MEQADTIVQIPHFYGSLKGMQKKFDNYSPDPPERNGKVGKRLPERL